MVPTPIDRLIVFDTDGIKPIEVPTPVDRSIVFDTDGIKRAGGR